MCRVRRGSTNPSIALQTPSVYSILHQGMMKLLRKSNLYTGQNT